MYSKMHGCIQTMLICFIAILLRWCITYHSYSGQEKPPMFGDYEAQRHWQEITLNVPIEKWYINTTDNDLQYWGLDYPPLTAYHSFVMGHIANRLNSCYVKLYESRGLSSEDHKYFMRLTVLCIDSFLYIPAVVYFVLVHSTSKNVKSTDFNVFGLQKKHTHLFIMLIYPGLMLIDHGHFQYNCFSLGLFVSAISAILQNSFIIGSILFVAALSYKQMELYHALPIFFYILGRCRYKKDHLCSFNLIMLTSISFTVILTFFVIWFPFLGSYEILKNVIFRLFPLDRGVFEDKVANIWCAINVFYKLRNIFTNKQLANICLIVTTAAVLPSSINLYLVPQKGRFMISLINCALAFYLFSFQVHEKSILLVAIPVLLYFESDSRACFWFLLISHFSMLPLFIKDGLYIAYCATLTLYFFFVLWVNLDIFNNKELLKHINVNKDSHGAVDLKQVKTKFKTCRNKSNFNQLKYNILYFYKNNVSSNHDLSFWISIVFYSSILGIIILSILSAFLKPPTKYPDLFTLLVSMYSCGHFIIFYLYFNYKQFVYKEI